MQHILLTGFAPFGGESINPSWQAVKQLDGWQPDGLHQVVAVELSCSFAECGVELATALAQYQPTIILAVGQAGGRAKLNLEQVAINLIEARIPDNLGAQPRGMPVIVDAPTAYFSTLPLKAMLQALLQQEIPAEISYSAGTFVCNAALYHLLHLLSRQTNQQAQSKAGFLHIPYSPAQVVQHPDTPAMETNQVVRALRICIEQAIAPAPVIEERSGTLD